MPDELMNKKTHLGGCIFSKWPNVKNLFFSKKIFFRIFSNFFLAHLKRNLFLILKWFYFLIFAQNWPICEGFMGQNFNIQIWSCTLVSKLKLFSKLPKVKNQFFSKKIFGQILFSNFFAYLKWNLFLILNGLTF